MVKTYNRPPNKYQQELLDKGNSKVWICTDENEEITFQSLLHYECEDFAKNNPELVSYITYYVKED